MRSKFKMYVIVWAVVVVLFNVIVFITPNEVAGMSKFAGAFWVGYAFIMILFLAQLGIGWYAIKDDLTKTFYNIPLLQIASAHFAFVHYHMLLSLSYDSFTCKLLQKLTFFVSII